MTLPPPLRRHSRAQAGGRRSATGISTGCSTTQYPGGSRASRIRCFAGAGQAAELSNSAPTASATRRPRWLRRTRESSRSSSPSSASEPRRASNSVQGASGHRCRQVARSTPRFKRSPISARPPPAGVGSARPILRHTPALGRQPARYRQVGGSRPPPSPLRSAEGPRPTHSPISQVLRLWRQA